MTYDDAFDNPAACGRLERDLAGFLDGTLDRSGSEWVADHLTLCARCAALLDGLDAPGELGAAMRALPVMRAPAGLWDGVARRIEAPVVELAPARAAHVAHEERSRQARGPARWLRSGVAAAALVAVTAGVTYELTVRQRQAAPADGSQLAMTRPSPVTAEPTAPTTVATTTPDESTTPASASSTGSSTGSSTAPTTAANAGARLTNRGVRTVARGPLPEDAARYTYDREIGKLRGILAERGSQLDTSTVRVLTESMRVIDRAIAQSRAALAKDPASGFLNQQLNNALDRKLELLRTAALLPART